VTSCANVTCPTGERCTLGTCSTDPCGHACPNDEVCNDSSSTCVPNPCTDRTCPTGQYCDEHDGGQCEADPCVGTSCPDPSQTCVGGTCFGSDQIGPDAGTQVNVTTGGGGCDAGGDGAGGTGLLIGIAAFVSRRRGLLGGSL
jgi:hypothetical protein